MNHGSILLYVIISSWLLFASKAQVQNCTKHTDCYYDQCIGEYNYGCSCANGERCLSYWNIGITDWTCWLQKYIGATSYNLQCPVKITSTQNCLKTADCMYASCNQVNQPGHTVYSMGM